MIRTLCDLAEALAAREAEARAEGVSLLSTRAPALALAMARARCRTAATRSERRHAARVVDLMEQACAQPDTATRWADRSGRWDGTPAERLTNRPIPLGLAALGMLDGACSIRREARPTPGPGG